MVSAKVIARREDLALRCKRGTWAQMRGLASAALLLQMFPTWHKTKEAGYSFSCDWDFVDREDIPGGFAPIRFICIDEQPFFRSWHDALAEVFEPRYFGGSEPWPRALVSHLSWARLWEMGTVSFPDSPSAHERLEALLLVTDWVEKNCPQKAEILLQFPS